MTNVTLPVVITNSKSPSLVFVVMNLSTFVDPDNLMNELTSSLESSGIVTSEAEAIVSESKPNTLSCLSFHSIRFLKFV